MRKRHPKSLSLPLPSTVWSSTLCISSAPQTPPTTSLISPPTPRNLHRLLSSLFFSYPSTIFPFSSCILYQHHTHDVQLGVQGRLHRDTQTRMMIFWQCHRHSSSVCYSFSSWLGQRTRNKHNDIPLLDFIFTTPHLPFPYNVHDIAAILSSARGEGARYDFFFLLFTHVARSSCFCTCPSIGYRCLMYVACPCIIHDLVSGHGPSLGDGKMDS